MPTPPPRQRSRCRLFQYFASYFDTPFYVDFIDFSSCFIFRSLICSFRRALHQFERRRRQKIYARIDDFRFMFLPRQPRRLPRYASAGSDAARARFRLRSSFRGFVAIAAVRAAASLLSPTRWRRFMLSLLLLAFHAAPAERRYRSESPRHMCRLAVFPVSFCAGIASFLRRCSSRQFPTVSRHRGVGKLPMSFPSPPRFTPFLKQQPPPAAAGTAPAMPPF